MDYFMVSVLRIIVSALLMSLLSIAPSNADITTLAPAPAQSGFIQTAELQQSEVKVENKRLRQKHLRQLADIAYRQGNYKKAFNIYMNLVSMGSERAVFEVAVMYYAGRGVEENPEMALKFALAAEGAGYKLARTLLGDIYRDKSIEFRSIEQSVNWYTKAAEGGERMAQYKLGALYYFGDEIDANPKKAMNYLTKSAAQKNVNALSLLGEIYQLGYEGVAINYQLALKYNYGAAIKGDRIAQNNLAMMYKDGLGVQKDHDKAAPWFLAASDQGHSQAQLVRGMMTKYGVGVPKSIADAYFWTALSLKSGSTAARQKLEDLGNLLSREKIRKTEKKVAAWNPVRFKPSNYDLPPPPPGVATAPLVKTAAAKAVTQVMAIAKPLSIALPTKPISLNYREVAQKPDDIAVVIGIANYGRLGKDIPDVVPAYADANGMKQWLMKSKGIREGNIIHLKDATSAQMTGVFGNQSSHKGKLFNWTKPGKSNIYVYYAGHGAPGENGSSAVLVPSDATADTLNLVGYSLETLYKNLAKIPAKSITVILEACFSGSSQGGSVIARTSGLMIRPKIPPAPGNITVISAGAADQVASWEEDSSHSLFTKYFLMGMSGEGDKKPYGNGDGTTSYDELKSWLADSMTYRARRYYGRTQTAQITVR
ncbi:MAG: hypothetical protein HON65_03450 [Rhodospirillales bacterium]|jgi:TPR repeat protein|nr:hypothetical protein [Rhodospirillales bacterium]